MLFVFIIIGSMLFEHQETKCTTKHRKYYITTNLQYVCISLFQKPDINILLSEGHFFIIFIIHIISKYNKIINCIVTGNMQVLKVLA